MASEAQCRDFNTEVSALLKMEDITSPLDAMSSKVNIKYQELYDGISSSKEVLGKDFIIYGSSPAEPKLQEVQMQTNEFFTRLGETTQAVFDEGKGRALQEVAWLKEAINKEMERLGQENEELDNESQGLRDHNFALANDTSGNHDAAIAANNAKIEANNAKINENNQTMENLYQKFEQCITHESNVSATSADYKIKVVMGDWDSRVLSYANALAAAMGRGDGDEVDNIIEDMHNELGIDQKGLEKEIGRLGSEANRLGDHFYEDELRALYHSIKTGEGIEVEAENAPFLNNMTSSAGTEVFIPNHVGQSNVLAVPTSHEEMVEAMRNGQPIVIKQGSALVVDTDGFGAHYKIDASDGDKYLVYHRAEPIPGQYSDNSGYYLSDADGNKLERVRINPNTLAGGTYSADLDRNPMMNYSSTSNDSYFYYHGDEQVAAQASSATAGAVAGATQISMPTTTQFTEDGTVGFASEQYTEGPVQSAPTLTQPVAETQPAVATRGNTNAGGAYSTDHPF